MRNVRDPIKRRAYNQRYNAEHRAEIRARLLLTRYGLTVEEYGEYLDAQEGCCAFCGEAFTNQRGRIAVDHDHETGEYRGLVHFACNLVIAMGERHLIGYLAAC